MDTEQEQAEITDRVVDGFSALFDRIFSIPFRSSIRQTLKRKEVLRQVEQAADAASQSLTRLFLNERLPLAQVEAMLEGLAPFLAGLDLERIGNPNLSPEALVDRLLAEHPLPAAVTATGREPLFRISLHGIVQVLTLVGPIMAEWQRLAFSTSFELPRRVVDRLNRISEQLDALARSGQDAADERYDLLHRDYLLQRFHRVEAGTVRMTTSLDVDLRELFVMPQVRVRADRDRPDSGPIDDLMGLQAARSRFAKRKVGHGSADEKPETADRGLDALSQVRASRRLVIVGAPGSGKSTFLEWLQLQVAGGNEELPLHGAQAVPLLLRVRQLDMQALPTGAGLIAAATASQDRARLMPPGWIQRQLERGRVLLMLDGLDETEPSLRDRYLLPWLARLTEHYPEGHILVSSRPSGYPAGALERLGFSECDLLDFGPPQIAEYTCHWCTAVRLARNEPEPEARAAGKTDGEQILDGFKGNPYIHDLARNPLMLSAICLVNWFEGGQLPQDRALLYRLCVEGLLHHWDQRRGIHSEYGLEEKLRVSREVALAMQAQDLAELGADGVLGVFNEVLGDAGRAERLLEHIRYRTGLLVERRPGVFAFAHLTFQEFLAAQAIHEGNLLGMGPDILAPGHADPRWQEAVVLFCGLSTASSALAVLRDLMESADSDSLGAVLADAYRAAEGRIGTDPGLRTRILERIARSPYDWPNKGLEQFPEDEVAPIANRWLGTMPDAERLSSAFGWLRNRPDRIDEQVQLDKLADWRKIKARPLSELVFLLHSHGDIDPLLALWDYAALCQSDGPSTAHQHYGCQAEIALMGLSQREPLEGDAVVALLPPLLLTAASKLDGRSESSYYLERLFRRPEWTSLSPADVRPIAPLLADAVPKLIRRLREIGERLVSDRPAATKAPRHRGDTTPAIEALESWLALIQSIAGGETPPANQTGAQA